MSRPLTCPLPVGPLPAGLDVRRTDPIYKVTAPNGVAGWIVTDPLLAKMVLADSRFSSAHALGSDSPVPTVIAPATDSITSATGAQHARLRSSIAGAFTEKRTALYESMIEQLATAALEEMIQGGSPADIVGGYCSRLPLSVLCRVLGVPTADEDVFRGLVPVLFELDGDPAIARDKGFKLAKYMHMLVASKRKVPADDLLSTLIFAADTSNRLTDRELVTMCLTLLMAGYDSTGDQLSLCFLTLLHDQQRWLKLVNDPLAVRVEVEEVLRLNPSAPLSFARSCAEPVDLGGVTVKPGELIMVFAMAANQLSAPGAAHLTFGHGPHRCVGAPLARLQLTVALRVAASLLPSLALVTPVESISWKEGFATRGPLSMEVSW